MAFLVLWLNKVGFELMAIYENSLFSFCYNPALSLLNIIPENVVSGYGRLYFKGVSNG